MSSADSAAVIAIAAIAAMVVASGIAYITTEHAARTGRAIGPLTVYIFTCIVLALTVTAISMSVA